MVMTWPALSGALAAQLLAFALVMAVAWLARARSGNSGWVDVSWTFGLGAVCAAAALWPLTPASLPERQLLVAGLVVVWALRLGLQILQRTLSSDDDPRYADLARQWGPRAPLYMFGLLQFQAFASLPLMATVLVAAHRPGEALGVADWIGVALLLVAVVGEGIADRQLVACRRSEGSQGRVCDTGLWGWSRHPNYFFQWLGWIAYALIALDVSGAYAWGWIALLGPLSMYVLLVHVSGIPPLEAHMLRSRGDAYRAYQSRTSAFFPLPPGRVQSERKDEHGRSSHARLRDGAAS